MKSPVTHDALLEVGVETLPARFLPIALARLKHWIEAYFKEHGLEHSGIDVYGAPLRIAAIITGIPPKTRTKELEVTGPPARLLKDDKGKFTPQSAGFARKQGIKPEQLTTVTLPKGEFLAAKIVVKGKSANEVLSEIFPLIIESVGKDLPKTMVWEPSKFRFGRPIRTLVALYGKKPVKFMIAGVRSGTKTRGLAAMGAKPIAITSPDAYVKTLRNRCVLVDPEEREEKLLKTLHLAAKKAIGYLDEDEALIEHTVGLTEHPVAVLGQFDKKFLDLPKPLLLMVLKKQLMFFPVLKKNGELTNDFIGVRDGLSEGQKEIRKGFEKVIEARFKDARFFIERDRETRLEDRLGKLDRVGFQKGLGSMGDKTARVVGLSKWLMQALLQHRPLEGAVVEKTAQLAYADLVTDVIGEFPELQGTMGGVYARAEGLDERIALGLEEFYYPTAANGPLPTTMEGCVVSLAGKMDTIAAMFSAGFTPSGSEDPFALRRLGNGVIRILLERQIRLSLPELAAKAIELTGTFPSGRTFDKAQTQKDVEEFLWQRLETLLLDKDFKIDEIRAVREDGLESLSGTFQRIAAVHQLRPEADFLSIAQAFKRASNILKKSPARVNGADVEQELLKEDAERGLFEALCRIESDVREKISQDLYEDGLRSLVSLKPQVDLFFDKVHVMDNDEAVKTNRINLLSRLVRLFKSVADISHIQN